MKKIFLVVLAIAFHVSLIAQNTSVPYRVGEKFGISDQNGKMLIQPQFDVVKISRYKNYFEAFKFLKTDFLSSFIFNNKIILKDKKYHNYYLHLDLIQATKYKSDSYNKVHLDNDNYATDYMHLYNLDGKIVISNNNKDIYCSQLNSENQLSEVIIHTIDINNLNSLFLYDKKLKKITQTFFKDSDYFEELSSRNYTTTEYIYKDSNKNGKKITLEVINNKVKITSTNDFEFKELQYISGDNDLTMAAGEDYEKFEISPLAITVIKQIKIKNKYNNFINRTEQITFSDYKLSVQYNYILEKDGKLGMFFVQNKKMLIPQEYDEIIKSDDYAGYILKKNNKYGYFIYEDFFINPVFDKIPILENQEYFGENQPLFKLFDTNNTFFCYADKNGKLFYSEK